MEKFGGKAMDRERAKILADDIMVLHESNSNLFEFDKSIYDYHRKIHVGTMSWLATMSSTLGADYYAQIKGPLPFVFGKMPPER